METTRSYDFWYVNAGDSQNSSVNGARFLKNLYFLNKQIGNLQRAFIKLSTPK